MIPPQPPPARKRIPAMKLARTLSIAFPILVSAFSLHARDADEVSPLLVGSDVPKVTLADEAGVAQFLPALLKDKYSILVFYRGGWCPYCNTHLQELAEAEAKLVGLGYQIIAISPDAPEHLASAEKDSELSYALYSDSGLEAATAFGIDFTLGKATVLRYKTFGIDLAESSGGNNKNRLPVPSVFIVTPDNKIAFTYVNPDYKQRIPGDLLLAAAEALRD